MTLDIIKQLPITPLEDSFLDSLFNQDKTSTYYRFMYRLCKLVNSKLTVELGVCSGRGTAHLAAGTNGTVIAIDPNPWDINYILQKYPNITLKKIYSNDKQVLESITDGSVDICFVDTNHEYEQVTLETKLWNPKMKVGGIMLFDDINYNDGMKRFWNELSMNKISLPHLHWTGFGVAIK